MSLKCSIFGHRFDDPVVERSRDESGSEVVITIREIQTCGRCGHQRVVSENKEVTTLETPDEADGGGGEETVTAAESTPEPEPAPDEGATILEDETVVAEAESDGTRAVDELAEEPADEPTDDGIILEDEEPAEPDREPGAWPEEPGEDEAGWEPPTDVAGEPEPVEETGPSVEPTGEAVTVPEGIFRCPSCGFTTPVEASSLRAGDFCPECHTGSLTHERQEP